MTTCVIEVVRRRHLVFDLQWILAKVDDTNFLLENSWVLLWRIVHQEHPRDET